MLTTAVMFGLVVSDGSGVERPSKPSRRRRPTTTAASSRSTIGVETNTTVQEVDAPHQQLLDDHVHHHQALVLLQACMRRFLQQRPYHRMIELQRQLWAEQAKHQDGLAQIQRRKDRKLCKLQQKANLFQEQQEQLAEEDNTPMVMATDMIQFLRRERRRLQLETAKQNQLCLDLKQENRHLERTWTIIASQIQGVQAKIQDLEASQGLLLQTARAYQVVLDELCHQQQCRSHASVAAAVAMTDEICGVNRTFEEQDDDDEEVYKRTTTDSAGMAANTNYMYGSRIEIYCVQV